MLQEHNTGEYPQIYKFNKSKLNINTSKNIDFSCESRSEKSSSTTSQDDSNNVISSCGSSQSSAASEQQRPFRFPTLSIDRSAIPCKWEDCGQGFKSHARLSDHIKVFILH